MSEPYGAMSFLLLVSMSLCATFGELEVLRLWGSGFCWVCVKPLIGSVLTMDWGCYKWSRDIIQALIGAQLVGMCLSEHIFTSEFTTETPRPETDAARQGGIAQAGLHLRSRDKQNSSMSECPAQWRSFPHHLDTRNSLCMWIPFSRALLFLRFVGFDRILRCANQCLSINVDRCSSSTSRIRTTLALSSLTNASSFIKIRTYLIFCQSQKIFVLSSLKRGLQK